MILAEFSRKLDSDESYYSSLWDQVDRAEFDRKVANAMVTKEITFIGGVKASDHREPAESPAESTLGTDADQDWATALSLLDTAKDLLTKCDKFLDARNLSLPADADAYMCRTIMDIQQFLDFFDQTEHKTVVLGPVKKTKKDKLTESKTKLSWGCRNEEHSDCDLVSCDCVCHDSEKPKGRKK